MSVVYNRCIGRFRDRGRFGCGFKGPFGVYDRVLVCGFIVSGADIQSGVYKTVTQNGACYDCYNDVFHGFDSFQVGVGFCYGCVMAEVKGEVKYIFCFDDQKVLSV